MLYFSTIDQCSERIQQVIDDVVLQGKLSLASKKRFKAEFTWEKVLSEYLLHFEKLLEPKTDVLLDKK
jgi:polyhydroxyalkanoate synthesis regulator phasin